MIKKIRHIGIIVNDFEKAVKKFEGFAMRSNKGKQMG